MKRMLRLLIVTAVLTLGHVHPLIAQWVKTSGAGSANVTNFAVSGSNLFAGFNTAYNSGGVILSTDDGTTWSGASSGLPSVSVTALAAFDTNLFAGVYDAGPYRSTNNGTSWTSANTGVGWYVYGFAEIGTNLFAGTYGGGIYISTNKGTSWTAVNAGLTHMSIRALVVKGTYLFAGGDSTGVLRRPLSEMITSVEQSSAGLPAEFSLGQNYPNPFNPSTTIRYALPERSRVTLTVFNSLGQPVSTLVSGTEEGGYHEVRFNGTNLASGVYFYRIQAGGFVQTRKFVLLK